MQQGERATVESMMNREEYERAFAVFESMFAEWPRFDGEASAMAFDGAKRVLSLHSNGPHGRDEFARRIGEWTAVASAFGCSVELRHFRNVIMATPEWCDANRDALEAIGRGGA